MDPAYFNLALYLVGVLLNWHVDMVTSVAKEQYVRYISGPSASPLSSVASLVPTSTASPFDPESSCSNPPWTPLATSTATSTPVFPPVDTPEPVFEAVQPDLSGDYSLVLAIWIVAAAVVVPCLLRAVHHARASRQREMCLTIAHEPEQSSTVLPELAVDDWRLFKAYVSSELPAIEAAVFDSAPGPVHKALWALSAIEYGIEVERSLRGDFRLKYRQQRAHLKGLSREQKQRLESEADAKVRTALGRGAFALSEEKANSRTLKERIQQLEASNGRPRRRVGSSIAVTGSASRRTVSTGTQTDVLAANLEVSAPPSSPDAPPQAAPPHEFSTDLLSSLPGAFPLFSEEETPSSTSTEEVIAQETGESTLSPAYAPVPEAVDDRQPGTTIPEADVQTFTAGDEATEAVNLEAVDDRQPEITNTEADVQTFAAEGEPTEAAIPEAAIPEAVDDRQPEITVAEADVQTFTAGAKVAEVVDPEAVDDRQSEIATPEADVQETSRILSNDDVTSASIVADDDEPRKSVHFAPDEPTYKGKGKKSMLPEPDETQQPLFGAENDHLQPDAVSTETIPASALDMQPAAHTPQALSEQTASEMPAPQPTTLDGHSSTGHETVATAPPSDNLFAGSVVEAPLAPLPAPRRPKQQHAKTRQEFVFKSCIAKSSSTKSRPSTMKQAEILAAMGAGDASQSYDSAQNPVEASNDEVYTPQIDYSSQNEVYASQNTSDAPQSTSDASQDTYHAPQDFSAASQSTLNAPQSTFNTTQENGALQSNGTIEENHPQKTEKEEDIELVNQAREMVVDNGSGADRQPPGDSIDHGMPEGGENTANKPVEDPMDHDGSKDGGKDDDSHMGEAPEESDEDDDGDDDGDAPMREASGHGSQGDDVSQAGAHDANLAGSNAPQTNVMPSGPYTPLNASTVLPGLSMPSGPYAPLTASTMLPGLSVSSGASAPSAPAMLPGPSVPSGPFMLFGPPDPLQALNTSSSSGPIIWNLHRTCFQVEMPSPQAMAEFNKLKRMVESRSFERTSFSEQSPFFDWHYAMQRARDSLRPAALPHQAPPAIVPQSAISLPQPQLAPQAQHSNDPPKNRIVGRPGLATGLPQPQLAPQAQHPNNPPKNRIVGRPGIAMTQPQAQQSNANTSQAPAANVTGQALQSQVYPQQAQTDTETLDVRGKKRQKSKVEEPVNGAGSATATFAVPNSRFNTNPSMAPSLTRPTIRSPFAPLDQPSHIQASAPAIPPSFLSNQPSYAPAFSPAFLTNSTSPYAAGSQPSYTQASGSTFPPNSMSPYAPGNQPSHTPASGSTFPPNSASANAPGNRLNAQPPTGQAQTFKTMYKGRVDNQLYMYPASKGPMEATELIEDWMTDACSKAWRYKQEADLGSLTELATDPTSELKTLEKQMSFIEEFVEMGRLDWDFAGEWPKQFFTATKKDVELLIKAFKELGEDHGCRHLFVQLVACLQQLHGNLEKLDSRREERVKRGEIAFK